MELALELKGKLSIDVRPSERQNAILGYIDDILG